MESQRQQQETLTAEPRVAPAEEDDYYDDGYDHDDDDSYYYYEDDYGNVAVETSTWAVPTGSPSSVQTANATTTRTRPSQQQQSSSSFYLSSSGSVQLSLLTPEEGGRLRCVRARYSCSRGGHTVGEDRMWKQQCTPVFLKCG